MTLPVILVSTWSTGLFTIAGGTMRHDMTHQQVCALTRDDHGGALAIINTHTLSRRSPAGVWQTIAESEYPLSCCVAVGDFIFVGTEDANVLRVDRNGTQQRLSGFDTVEGREKWYAGGTTINGRYLGPPLGVRSVTATRDGTLFANVHVGGIPRSTDGGKTWHPTIDIACDVHEVRAHPSRPELVIAASAVGLCISRDGGTTWSIETRGLHAPYCSAVAFGRNDIFVSASVRTFEGPHVVYRRPIDDDDSILQPVNGGMPASTQSRTDTGSIATRGSWVAIADGSGFIHLSQDDGANWTQIPASLPYASTGPLAQMEYTPSGILIC